MTLVMTLIRPEGIWQSVDYRLTNSQTGATLDEAAPKQLSILCPPLPDGPKVLLAFTGLAEAPGGKPMIQWIRETIRGEQRPIMPMLEHLRDRLTRDIGRSHLGRFVLILTGGIFEGSGKRFYFEINNIDPATLKPRRTFRCGVFEVTEPEVRAAGLGQRAVAEADKELILQRPANWQDQLQIMAAINRRAADRDRSIDPVHVGSVSRWCQVSYLAPGETGVHIQDFREPGEPAKELSMEVVMSGIDFTDSMRVFLARTRGAALTDKDMEDAKRRGLKGRE